MNGATFSSMSRLLCRQKNNLAILSRLSGGGDSKLAQMAATNYLLLKRSSSSSSVSTTNPTSTSAATTTFGTGEFGQPSATPKDLSIHGLRPEDQLGPDENPYAYSPVYRKGIFDGLFGDGWRRPPAKEEGQKMRRDWISFGWHPTDEYVDWKTHHKVMFWLYTIFMCGSMFFLGYRPDWPHLNEWAIREAYIEIARREKYGLPYIAKDYIDPEKIKAILPSEEELGDFEIII